MGRLRVTGTSPASFTYFNGTPIELKQGVTHRLAAKLLVEKIDPWIVPSFTFLYLGKPGGPWVWDFIGLAETGKYSLKTGGWQTLTVDFMIPAAARGGRIHFSKTQNQPISILTAIEKIELVELG